MPCPHGHGSGRGGGDEGGDRSRREFVRAAVAIGGVSAFAACAERSDREPDPGTPQFEQGPDDLSTIPERQHAWGEYIPRDRQGRVVFPRHQAFIFLKYTRDGPPSESDRETVESAFRTLERAYQRGAGNNTTASEITGLLFTVSYAPSYFERFSADLPPSLDLPRAERTLEELGEDTSKADDHDAVLHLASDLPEIMLAAEEALFGEVETINGFVMEGTLADVFERAERRTGFVGHGMPASELANEDVPQRSPISMGFRSNFDDGFTSEDKVTLREGPFADGTLHHISRLHNKLDDWYSQDHKDRVEKMFSPAHSPTDTGEVGDLLGANSSVGEDVPEKTIGYAREYGRVGHGQKTKRARDEDDDPIILRRGDFNSALDPGAALHFGSIQRAFEDFVETREAMNEIGFDADSEDIPTIPDEENGILDFIEVNSRANFLMPPRRHRSLPTPNPGV